MRNDECILTGRRVLVTDGEQRAALAVVRSLGAAGAVPFVCSASGRSLAGASRFARAEFRNADPLEDPGEFVATISAIVRDTDIECLLPITESSLRPILRSSDVLPQGVKVPFPPHDMFSAASDKRRVTELATELGVPVPRQVVLASADPTDRAARIDLRFPVVLKPATSVATGNGRAVKLSVRHAADLRQFEAEMVEWPPAAFPLLVQERIQGAGVGIFLLRWDGRILARFAHRRLREKPPSGGVSVYRESIDPPPEALAHAEALLEALDWQGVAMVEFKLDARSGTPYLMEINGRFWGSLQLAIDAGVNFPRLLVEAAFGHVRMQPAYGRPGVRLRWLLGDLDYLLLRLRKSTAELAMDNDAPGRLRALGSVLLPWRPGERWEVLRPSDTRPFGRELKDWAGNAFSSR